MEIDKLERAKKRLEKLKGFYIHLSIYLVINSIVMGSFVIRSMDTNYDFWSFPTFMTPVFWGIGLLIHGLHTFQVLPFARSGWEERRIAEFMEEYKKESENFN